MCEHDFPERQDFCTHLGHETLGSHSRHYVCRKCGALKTIRLGSSNLVITSANEAMLSIYRWRLLTAPHQCSAGWRGQVVADMPSTGPLEQPPLPPPLECERRCSSCGRQIIDGRWTCCCRGIHTLMMVLTLGGSVALMAWALCRIFS